MKNVLSLFLITAFFGTTVLFSGGQEHGSKQEIHDRLIGAWRLAGLEEPDADGTVHKAARTHRANEQSLNERQFFLAVETHERGFILWICPSRTTLHW
jgi:hypothetical protein